MKNYCWAISLCLLSSACVPLSEFGLGVDEIAGPPVITLSSSVASGTINDASVLVTLTATENIVGLVAGDFSCSNCNVTNLSGSGASYTFLVEPTPDTAFNVKLALGSVSDASGNLNDAESNTLDWISDQTAPSAVAGVSPFTGAQLSSTTVSISGTCEDGATVFFTGNISGSPASTSCLGGTFSKSVTLNSTDTNTTITIYQEDDAGNQSANASVIYNALSNSPLSIASSGSHACSLMSDDSLMCWGLNDNGQLGDNSTNDRNAPVSVSSLTNVAEFSVGTSHTCALDSSNDLYCWGDNTSGQLGNPSTPVLVPTASIFDGTNSPTGGSLSAPSAGGQHTCVVADDATNSGVVYCTGSNSDGQLGSGSVGTDVSEFFQVTGFTDADKLATGTAHTCALKLDGSVFCWGDNEFWQLGNNDPDAQDASANDSLAPVQVSDGSTAISGIAKIASKGNFTCALDTGAPTKVWCWGQNADGQLGNALNADSNIAVQVSGLTGATEIATGLNHACAIKSDKTVVCWGDNSQGQLGDGLTADSNVPVAVSGLSRAESLAAGEFHTCAKLEFGTVVCWGDNAFWQLGNNDPDAQDASANDSLSPVVVDFAP